MNTLNYLRKNLCERFLTLLIFLSLSQLAFAQLPTEIDVSSEFTCPSFANPGDNSYTPVWTHNGSTYFVWVDGNWRPWVTKLTNGIEETVPLDPNPDYTTLGSDGHHKFSMGIDTDGYIHITGDMHNYPGHTSHMPERFHDKIIMYWVSDEPESISNGFSFVGGDANRAMDGTTFSYGAFYADKFGKLYYRSRVRAVDSNPSTHFTGEMGVGLYRYNTQNKSWTALGKKASMTKNGASFYNVITWIEKGHHGDWYQGYRGTVRFDDNNRLHYAEPITAVSFMDPSHIIYAYSDDEGETFKQANGTNIVLPMTSQSGASQASIVNDYTHNGSTGVHDIHTGVFVDVNNIPAVTFYRRSVGGSGSYRHWNTSSNSWSNMETPSCGAGIREMHFVHPAGFMIFINNASGKITVANNFGETGNTFDTGFDTFRSMDEAGLRRTGVLRASGEKNGKLHVIKITFPGFEITDPTATITSLNLINATTEQVVAGYENLTDLDNIFKAGLPVSEFNIYANVNISVDSVIFSHTYDGITEIRKAEVTPYSLKGTGAEYLSWHLPNGLHKIDVIAYLNGQASLTKTAEFSVSEDLIVLTPIDDAYLQGGTGFNTQDLRIEAGNRVSYLKFDLSAIQGDISSAQLRLSVGTDAGNGTLLLEGGNSNDWTEDDITLSNAPTSTGLIDQLTASFGIGSPHSFDVSSYVHDNNIYSFILSMASGGNDVSFASSESSPAPQLIVTTDHVTETESNGVRPIMEIFPNPNTGTIHFTAKPDALELFSMDGTIVKTSSTITKSEIDLTDLKSGLYIVKVLHGNSTTHHKIKIN